MPALTRPQHQSVAYLWQDKTKTILSTYDKQTGSKKNLLTFSENASVAANVSPDGHWIIVTQLTRGVGNAIKLVRIDGAYAQTLYCSASDNLLSSVLLSPNQHSLVFSESSNPILANPQFTLKRLDMATGKIQTLLSSLQPGYPGIQTLPQALGGTATQASSQQSQANIHAYSQLFMPQPGPPPVLGYLALKWASNSSLYLQSTSLVLSGGGIPPHDLYQLLDINKPVEQQSSNLKSLTAPLKQTNCDSYDITADNTQLICSGGPLYGDPRRPAVRVEAVSGQSLHTVFTASPDDQVFARAARDHTILFTVNNVKTNVAQFYQINTDGSALKLLASAKASEYTFESYTKSGDNSYLPWTNVSRDGKYYALISTTNYINSLVIGKMNGGSSNPNKIATNLQLRIVGWTAA
ncbi:hypothetical protein KDW_41730 [Dictyobacter vulcani]|uniref:Uncharacterized protein n=2 Tax=Dictyobacter vulcani TaxID=2607529 RepID=A0A5J4KU59_9CHLR|nr:hypothetical protein KDW_41730 [Dictyobacter vulcani]